MKLRLMLLRAGAADKFPSAVRLLDCLIRRRMHIHEEFKRLSVFEANGKRHIQGFTRQDVNGIAFCASRIKELPFLQQFVLAHQKIALAQARNSDSEVRECLLAPIDQLRTDEKLPRKSGRAS